MPKQPVFPSLRAAMKKKLTRRELFLAEMEVVVPWGRRGLAKNRPQLFTLFALGNLFLVRKRLMA